MSITQKNGGDPEAPPATSENEELGAAGAQLSTQPTDTLAQTPGLGVIGWLRWMWRQLTSMRVALILLFLLSLAAIPGSLIPQHSDQLKVDAFKQKHPTITPLYERLGMFHVYSSPWFSAIYILLFVSLAGCIVPRTWQFVGQLRSKPPAAPRNLTRLPAYSTWHTDATPEQVTAAAERALRGRRFRTSTSGSSVAGEKGYLREAGNLLFHVALFGLLIAFAATSLEGASGGKLIVEGDGFTNNPTQYDDFNGGTLYGKDDLKPFGFNLDSFDAAYATSGPERGSARMFRANIHYWNGADGKPVKGSISVNHPLSIGGEKVYLISHGYAPVVTVRDGQGNVAFHGPVPFLPQDNNGTATGVVKVPDALGKDGKPDELGFTGFFTPTGDTALGPRSVFPALDHPILWLSAFHGDLGIDSGIAQNVYQLDTTHMKQLDIGSKSGMRGDALTPGGRIVLPDGRGTLTFDGVKTWASFTVSHQAGNDWALFSGAAAILGLMGSLFIQRRRIWVRAVPSEGGDTLVEMGGLGRSESARIADELGDVALQLQPDAPAKPDPGDPADDGLPDDSAPQPADEGARA
ncbi:cytochrome c biogenesis protein ResB [Actinacidiphila acidipaludis]|uniref:Cytochrome c biogenesis protein ResB n=1 Tax=Actinacidiphila acidipaludis TaxID=2873382 RepID=A0ABS7Q8S3_9ACTN|nr:cytochrome c biogenesis protein ResB [Streptomyces acidipaludis]MBY8878174.1 cytochrome c biogenesis protein ResB [Streptomyces acidipaludis]